MRNLSGRLFFWVSIIATVVSMNFWSFSMLETEVTPLFITLTVINGACLITTLVCMAIDIYNIKKRKQVTVTVEITEKTEESEEIEEIEEIAEVEESVENAEAESDAEPAEAIQYVEEESVPALEMTEEP